MGNKTMTLVLVSLVCVFVPIRPSYASDDVSVGTWKLNAAKSTLPGPPPKSYINKIEVVDGRIKFTNDMIDAEGKHTHSEWTGKYDGMDYPIKGDPNRDTVARKKIDQYTVENMNKKGGKVTTIGRSVYSRDGKSKTETTTGTDAQGQKVDYIIFWERQ